MNSKPATGAVNKADVDLLVINEHATISKNTNLTCKQIKELQLSKADAESALRTNGGDVVVTLKKLIEC